MSRKPIAFQMDIAAPPLSNSKRAALAPTKVRANVSLSAGLLEAARQLGLNVSQACEFGLAHHVKRAQEQQWQDENAKAIAELNDYVDAHGVPLARFRNF